MERQTLVGKFAGVSADAVARRVTLENSRNEVKW
jgi:hypothetical protein